MKQYRFIIALAFVALAFTSQAQNQGYRSPNPSNANIGYEMAIEPQYGDIALDFSDGMAAVMLQRGQLPLYINTTGAPAFFRQFLNLSPFHGGLAAVEVDGKWGFIDKKGNDVIKAEYASVSDFSEGYAVVRYDVTGGGHYRSSFVDSTGTVVANTRFNHARGFSEGLAVVENSKGNRLVLNKRFVTNMGNLPYEEIKDFHEGLARVKVGDKYGFIDTTGQLVIAMRDDICGDRFSEGLCLVRQNGKYGYMDRLGRVVIPCRFTYATLFSCSRAVVSESAPDEASGMITGRGVIDHDGNYVVKEKEFDFIEPFSEDYAVVSLAGNYGFINVNGKVVIPMIYEGARSFHEGYAAVRINRLWGFLKLTQAPVKK